MSETPTHEALRQCRDALQDAIDRPFITENADWWIQVRAALAAADAALSVQAEPVAWRFAGSYWTRYESIHEALRKQVEPLYATPQPPAPVPAVPLTEEQIADIVRGHLTSVYACTRVWEAWSVGTMTEDDFVPAEETEMADEIAAEMVARITGGSNG